jgi:hypothetical protein
MNKKLMLIIILILVGTLIGGWLYFGSKKSEESSSQLEDKIKVTKPQPNEIISTPLEIEGEARGFWYFEAVFPIRLYDGKGNLLGQTAAQAQGDWMTEEFIQFRAELEFSPSTTESGLLILEKDNPSGLPENAGELKIPVIFKK